MAGLYSRGILPRTLISPYNGGMSGTSQDFRQPTATQRQPSPAEVLATPVEFVRGVGPQRAELLARLDVHNAADLIFLFPRDYQDLSDRREIGDLEEDQVQTVRGEVVEIDARSSGFGKSVVGVLVRQGHDYLRAIWFNQPFMREKFREGQHVLLSAKPRFRGGRWEMPHPRVTWLDGAEDQPEMRLLPLYPLTEGLTQYQMRRIVANALEKFSPVLEEVFSDALLRQYDLMPLAAALRDFVCQQALGHLQTHFDGKRRQGLARHLQQRFHIERQLHFPGLRQRLLLDPPRPTATTPTTTATR